MSIRPVRRLILVLGKPLAGPVAWGGPIVVNTQEQRRQAFEELDQATFRKSGGQGYG